MGRGRRQVLGTMAAVALAGTLAGCPKPPPIPRYSMMDQQGAPTEPTSPIWSVTLPRELSRVRLHAFEDCLFVTAQKETSKLPARVQLCVNPADGEVRWAHSEEAAGSLQDADEYFFTPTRLLYVNRREVVALDRASGAVVWRFKDAGGLPIYQAFELDGALVMSLGNRRLAVLDGATGAWVRGFALRDEALKQVGALPDGRQVAVVLDVPQDDKAPPALVALQIDQGGAEADAKEPPKAPELWRTPVLSWSGAVTRVGQALIGEFLEGELWALALNDGAAIWKQRKASLPGSPFYLDAAVLLHKGDAAGSDDPQAPAAVRLMAVGPRELPQARALWTLELPGKGPLLGIEEQPGDVRALGATPSIFFQFDRDSGQLLWLEVFNRDSEGAWTNASSNGEAVFVFFEKPGEMGKLRRIPIMAQPGAAP